MRNLNVWAGIGMLLMLMTAGGAWAYQPPRMLLQVSTNSSINSHCNLGDINNDGLDDLIVRQVGRDGYLATFDIYYGGDTMSQRPGFVIPHDYPRESLGCFWNLGHFLPDMPPFLVANAYIYNPEVDTEFAYAAEFRLLCLGDSSLGDQRYAYRRPYDWLRSIGEIRPPGGNMLSRPTDLNGDGYDDLILTEVDSSRVILLEIYYGGALPDSTPDWVIQRPGVYGYSVSTSYDVNNDGFDDMLVRSGWNYDLYLGGSPMDTVPALSWDAQLFEGQKMTEGFALLPDLNGDGYDDWGLYFYELHDPPQSDRDGYYVWFGGEQLDLEPDVVLDGYPANGGYDGELAGGDFNGDGIGDIVACSAGAHQGGGALRFYFGRVQWPQTARADYEPFRDYGHDLGSVGDYNGDGSDDFAVYLSTTLTLYSGWPNPDFAVEPDLPATVDLDSRVYPNPFNNELTVTLKLERSAKTRVEVFDLTGRSVCLLNNGVLYPGGQTFHWSAERSGIYFVLIQSGSVLQVQKVISLK